MDALRTAFDSQSSDFFFRTACSYERVYALPPDLILEPQTVYRISGRIRAPKKNTRIFSFAFRTDSRGKPVAR